MTDFNTLITAATHSSAQALADIDALAQAAMQAKASLLDARRKAARSAMLAGFEGDLLKEFLDKPYFTRPLGDGQYELVVPRFIGFRAGWPVRHAGAYSVFLVTKFIHFINPLPDWLVNELGFGAPSFKANLEGNALTVVEGDAAAVYERLGGAKAIARREGDRLFLRPASRFDILRRIIREEGFLPFTPKPIAASLRRTPEIARDEQGHASFALREHQRRDYDRFLEFGAVSVFAYPQTGKSFVALQALAELHGDKLILCPRRSLVDQWQARLKLYLTPGAAAEVTVSTYQGARKHLDREYALVVFDEAHHMPADFAIESATSIKATSRIGLSATPRREDGNEDLIPALCGFPLGADWPISAAQRPAVTVWIVKDEAAKLRLARTLSAQPIDGKTFIFTYHLSIGERMARLLDVPFVQGKTKRPLDVIAECDTVVISSVGNEGLSFPVRRVIEIDFLFGSNMEAGQRLGRLAYEITGKKNAGEHHVLMTPDEYQRYSKRLLIYEQWGLDVDVRTPDGDSVESSARALPQRRSRAPVTRRTMTRSAPVYPQSETTEPADEISVIMSIPGVAAKLAAAEKSVGSRTAPYIRKAFRLCYTAAFSATDIAEGRGITDSATVSRYRSACKALLKAGLFKEITGRFTVDRDEINRLQALAGMVRK
jgi:hypothetical protein